MRPLSTFARGLGWFSYQPNTIVLMSHLGLDRSQTAHLAITLSHSSACVTTFPCGPLESPHRILESILAVIALHVVQFLGHLSQDCQSFVSGSFFSSVCLFSREFQDWFNSITHLALFWVFLLAYKPQSHEKHLRVFRGISALSF